MPRPLGTRRDYATAASWSGAGDHQFLGAAQIILAVEERLIIYDGHVESRGAENAVAELSAAQESGDSTRAAAASSPHPPDFRVVFVIPQAPQDTGVGLQACELPRMQSFDRVALLRNEIAGDGRQMRAQSVRGVDHAREIGLAQETDSSECRSSAGGGGRRDRQAVLLLARRFPARENRGVR